MHKLDLSDFLFIDSFMFLIFSSGCLIYSCVLQVHSQESIFLVNFLFACRGSVRSSIMLSICSLAASLSILYFIQFVLRSTIMYLKRLTLSTTLASFLISNFDYFFLITQVTDDLLKCINCILSLFPFISVLEIIFFF